jgi:hypothetical protein
MSWQFADKDHTTIRHVEEGIQFEWPRHVHPSNIHGHAAERWRNDGCPWPVAYSPEAPKLKPATADENARRTRRESSEPARNRGA